VLQEAELRECCGRMWLHARCMHGWVPQHHSSSIAGGQLEGSWRVDGGRGYDIEPLLQPLDGG
jgi:hypothetical protein